MATGQRSADGRLVGEDGPASVPVGMPKAEDGEPYYQALGPGGQKDDGDGSNWQKTGVFAPENQKKLGAGCVGLTVVIGVAVAITANVVGSGESAPSTGPSGPVGPLAFRGGFFIDPKHSDGTLNGASSLVVVPSRLQCYEQVPARLCANVLHEVSIGQALE